MLHAGEISSACSRAGADQNTAGAWCGEPVPTPLRVRIGKLQYSSMSAMTCQSGCSAIPKVSPLHGARSPRGQHTVTLAVRTTLANVLNKYGRWSAFLFVESCVDRD